MYEEENINVYNVKKGYFTKKVGFVFLYLYCFAIMRTFLPLSIEYIFNNYFILFNNNNHFLIVTFGRKRYIH